MVSVDDLETAGFNAWPALEQLLVAGWLIRFAEGYTKRANSANFLYPSTTPVEQLVAWCEQLYAVRKLPPIFRLVDRTETPPTDRLLAERGYQAIDPSVVLARVTLPRVLGVIVAGGRPVACGMGVVDRGLFGLFDLVTDPGHRRRGYGSQLIAGLIGRARAHGATTCFLQVAQHNQPARALYQKLGFREAYRYWYRVKPAADTP
jgi:ribosomal protein S18 acetylase RimI-like enzyme